MTIRDLDLLRAVVPDGRLLGVRDGGQGRSLHGVDRGGDEFLLKVLGHGDVADEVRSAASLRHPRIPATRRVGVLDDGRAFVLRDYVRGSVPDALSREPDLLVDQVLQVLEVLGFVHLRGVLHLDLKPANLVVDERDRVHLLDFGLAVRAGESARGGTPFFAAPEVLFGVPPDARADLFSLGAMVVHALLDDRGRVAEAVRRFPGEGLLAACGLPLARVPKQLQRFLVGVLPRDRARRVPDVASAIEALVGGGSGRPSAALLRPDPVQLFAGEIERALETTGDVRVVGAGADERRAVALHLAVHGVATRAVVERADELRLLRDGADDRTFDLRLPDLDAERLSRHLADVVGLAGEAARDAAVALLAHDRSVDGVARAFDRLVAAGQVVPAGSRWSWPDARARRLRAAAATTDGEPLAAAVARAARTGRHEQAEALLRSGDGLENERARIAYVEGLLDGGEPARALPWAAGQPLLRARALLDAGRFRLAAAELAALGEPTDEPHRRVAAQLALAAGDTARARRLLEELVGSRSGRVLLAVVLEQDGDFTRSRQLADACLAELQEDEQPFLAASLHTLVGHLDRRGGDLDAARAAFERAAALSQRIGHLRHLGSCELNLGVIAKDQGDLVSATMGLREARTLCDYVGDEARAAIATSNLGIVALLRDDAVGAREALQAGRQQLERLGDVASARLASVMLARAELRSGDRAAAERLLADLGEPDSERLRSECQALRAEMAQQDGIEHDGAMHDRADVADAQGALFRTFLAVNRKLAQARDLDEAMRGLLDAAVTLTAGRRGYLLVQREDGMRREFDSGSSEQAAQAFSRSLANRAIQEQRALTGADVLADEELQAMQSVRNLRVRSAICVPFDSAAGVRGAIYVEHAGRAGVFREADSRALEVLADQAAIAVDRMLREESMQKELSDSRRELAVVRRGSRRSAVRLLGESGVMEDLRAQVDKLAQLELAVLVTGETGTGKELVARSLHERGVRSQGPFVAENCSALPAELMERELFGHVEGAFTGADRDRPGLLELANGGTLFLDEVGDMPSALQVKLLRALQEREIRRVGGSQTIALDLRMVAATHKDLRAMVRDGSFREDLFFRLAAVELHVPALRERGGDVELLADHFVERHARERGVRLRLLASARAELRQYPWPGNVRELEHVIARAALLCDGEEVAELRLPTGQGLAAGAGDVAGAAAAGDTSEPVCTLQEAERRAIEAAMRHCGGDKAKAARTLGISRTALYDKLKRHGLFA